MDIDKISYEQHIEAAIALVKSQKKRNYSAAARKFKLGCRTVERRCEAHVSREQKPTPNTDNF
jgi:hypothetical protein